MNFGISIGYELKSTWAGDFKFGMQLPNGAQIIFPLSGRGLRHVTLQLLAYDRTYLQNYLS